MQWLSRNWLWIVFAIGIFFMMRRGGMGCGMGHGHSHGGKGKSPHQKDAGGPSPDQDSQKKDPVSGEIINQNTAVNTMHQGRSYYFASRDSRDVFEAAPEKYASPANGNGDDHPPHKHGC